MQGRYILRYKIAVKNMHAFWNMCFCFSFPSIRSLPLKKKKAAAIISQEVSNDHSALRRLLVYYFLLRDDTKSEKKNQNQNKKNLKCPGENLKGL